MIWKKKKDAAAQSAEAAGEMTGAKGRTGAGAFAKKNWKWLVPLVVVAAAGAVLLIGGGRNGAASRDVTYAETTPVRQDVSNSLSGTGTLNPANTYTVKSLVDGKILTGGFEEGDKVEEGDVLYTVDSSDATTKVEQAGITLQQAQRNYDKTVDRQYVRAEVAGVVSSLKVAKGDEVTSGQEVAVIRDNSKMTLALEFPAADAAGFSVGQSADVTLDGTFETMTGTITAVTGTDDKDVFCLLVDGHGDVDDHLVVDELVPLGEHHIAVQRQHPAKLRRLKNVDALIVALLGVELLVHPDAVLDVRGVKFRKPKFHLLLLMPEHSGAGCPGLPGRSCCSLWPWRTRYSSVSLW